MTALRRRRAVGMILGAVLVALGLGFEIATMTGSSPPESRNASIPDPACIVAWVGDTPISQANVDRFKAQAIPSPSGDEAARWAIDVVAAAQAAGLEGSASITEQRKAYATWFSELRRKPGMSSDKLLTARRSLHEAQRVRKGPCAPQAI